MVIYEGAWTWSRLRDAEQCKLLLRLRHIEKRPEPTSPALSEGARRHDALDDWLKGRSTFPAEEKRMKKELTALKRKPGLFSNASWRMTRQWKALPETGYFGKEDWVRAKADAAWVEGSTLEVVDFKTGRQYAVSEDQVRFYGVVGLLREIEAKLAQLHLWYLDSGKVKTTEPLKRKDVETLRADFEARAIKHIYEETKFKPTPGEHCRMCPFSKYKGGPCKF